MAVISKANVFTVGTPERSDELRIIAFMEASSITGPAKNLIEFAAYANRNTTGERRLHFSIATFERGKQPLNGFVAGARRAGVRIDVIRERYAFDVQVIPQIRAVIRSVKPHAIQTHNVKSHFLVWLMRLHNEYPWLAFHHGYTSIDWKDRLYRHFNRISLPAADRVVTVCTAFVPDLEKIGVTPERIKVQHNMTRVFVPSRDREVDEIRARLGLTGGELVVLSAGRLSREKAHVDLVEALALIRKTGGAPRFRVLFAGDGPEQKKLLNRGRQLGVEDLFLLIGHQEDLRPYYTMADILVLPSHSEGSPNVLFEAMAARIAIVATSVGGVPEIVIDEQSALLVPRRDPARLSEAMLRLLTDQKLRIRLAENARDRTRLYSCEAYCDTLLSTWSELLSHSRREELC